MTTFKTIAAALAALTLATTFTAIGGDAQARPRFGAGLGIGLAAGTLIGIAAATSGPGYAEPADIECGYVSRYDRWSNLRPVQICSVAPY